MKIFKVDTIKEASTIIKGYQDIIFKINNLNREIDSLVSKNFHEFSYKNLPKLFEIHINDEDFVKITLEDSFKIGNYNIVIHYRKGKKNIIPFTKTWINDLMTNKNNIL